MIRLFHPKTPKTDLIQYNGDYVLDKICYSALITEELNGEFSLNLKVVITDKMDKGCYDLIVEGALLVVNDEYGDEYFRIASVDKDLDEIEIYARQITIADTLTTWLEDVRPKEQNGNGAINWIFDNAVGGNKWFRVASNISDVNSANYVNKTVYEAISTADNSFLNRWGGEIERRGFSIKIDDRIGKDRGVEIRSRKNLIGFEVKTNINELTTRIYPKGFDGITIEEKYVDSELINNYPKVYTREIKFDDIRVNDENYSEGFATLEEAQAEIIKRCKELYKTKKIDVINAEYNINFVDLSKTKEYKNYSILEFTKIGDTVSVIEEKLKVNINVRVIKRQYDLLNKKRINTTLSDKDIKVTTPTIGDIITIVDKIPSADSILKDAKEQATSILNAGIKDSNVVLKKNELLIMDTPDVNTAQKVWRYNVNGLGYSNTGYNGEYGTAMTMDGSIVADYITTGQLSADRVRTGTIESVNKETVINLNNGEIKFTKGLIEGSNTKINLDSGEVKFTKGLIEGQNQTINLDKGSTEWRHNSGGNTEANANGFFRDGRPYLTMVTTGIATSGGSAGTYPKTVRIQLPEQFKGHNFSVACQVVNTLNDSSESAEEYVMSISLSWGNYDYANGTFEVTGYWKSGFGKFRNEKELVWSYIAIAG